jgi:ABC-type multidrug transport system fused ATPase/permease subunit
MIIKVLKMITEIGNSFRTRVFMIFLLTILMAVMEIIGIASIAPFMAVVSSPEIIQQNEYLNLAFNYFNFNGVNDFLISLGFLVILILLFNNIFSAFMMWLVTSFNRKFAHSLAIKLLSRYLNQPYAFFVNRNSADLSKNILSESHRVVTGVITPSIEIISKGVVTFFIIVGLIIVEPFVALLILTILLTIYLLIYIFFKNVLNEIGSKSTKAVLERYKVANEAISSVKELKLHAKEKEFISKFRKVSMKDASYSINADIIGIMPRYLLESLIFSGVILATIFLIHSGKTGVEIIPMLAVYTFAAYRVLPMMQAIYRGVTSVKFNIPALKILLDDFEASFGANVKTERNRIDNGNEVFFNSELEFKKVSFSYDVSAKPTLSNVNLKIKHPSKIGIVGKTGSGKTTLVDIILGLFIANSGEILIDGAKLTSSNISSWQKMLGYVPQDVYLSDDTIRNNIAFAVNENDIDLSRVKKSAKLAGIDSFINSLPQKYESNVGEKGVKLSGGQLQRIGIARALYFEPKLLVFDESTSALDGQTERVIMDSIDNLSKEKTIIIIAHRISTLESCDTIFFLQDGSIKSSGKYKDLLNNQDFKKLNNII